MAFDRWNLPYETWSEFFVMVLFSGHMGFFDSRATRLHARSLDHGSREGPQFKVYLEGRELRLVSVFDCRTCYSVL